MPALYHLSSDKGEGTKEITFAHQCVRKSAHTDVCEHKSSCTPHPNFFQNFTYFYTGYEDVHVRLNFYLIIFMELHHLKFPYEKQAYETPA